MAEEEKRIGGKGKGGEGSLILHMVIRVIDAGFVVKVIVRASNDRHYSIDKLDRSVEFLEMGFCGWKF